MLALGGRWRGKRGRGGRRGKGDRLAVGGGRGAMGLLHGRGSVCDVALCVWGAACCANQREEERRKERRKKKRKEKKKKKKKKRNMKKFKLEIFWGEK
jgi:hypothetical protein